MVDTYVIEQSKRLGLTYPFTESELKHNYRELAFKYHPDHNGDAEKFKALHTSYEFLLPFCSEKKSENAKTTFEGDLIINLGKGLGDTINSTDCPKCNGLGYHTQTHERFNYDKQVQYLCGYCHGKGKLKLFYYWINCPHCSGDGYTYKYKTINYNVIHTCSDCKGTGQILVPNPVLPKNRTVSNIKNEDKRPKKKYCSCGALMSAGKCWRCDK
jgi:DnaJ-class molecular chaperone